MDEERVELLSDAMAEFLCGLWQEEHKQRTAADAATSADEPASETEANQTGRQGTHHGPDNC
jgi:hypothetical protein